VSAGGVLARVRAAASASAWAPLAGRAAAYLCGFVALALVGSGRLSAWMSPASRIAIPVAEAAAPPVPSASARASPPPLPPPANSADADAGAPAEDGGAGEDGGAATGRGVSADGRVILNLATEEDLRRLPGVGPKRAKAILALRTRLKRFGRVEDLLKVKGLGRRSMARLRPLVQVD
jgi:competence protein ComEA